MFIFKGFLNIVHLEVYLFPVQRWVMVTILLFSVLLPLRTLTDSPDTAASFCFMARWQSAAPRNERYGELSLQTQMASQWAKKWDYRPPPKASAVHFNVGLVYCEERSTSCFSFQIFLWSFIPSCASPSPPCSQRPDLFFKCVWPYVSVYGYSISTVAIWLNKYSHYK